MNKRPYSLWYDYSADKTVTLQADNPANDEFLPVGAVNRRLITDLSGNQFAIGDQTVNIRGSKQIIWSSEGYTMNGVAVAALTNAQKAATGKSALNAGSLLDLSPYKSFVLIVNLISFTGGTSPSFQIELDTLDDVSPTPNAIPLYKPTAATAATSYYVVAGAGQGAAPTISGWTVASIPVSPSPNGQIQWTVAGAPTAISWTAFLYGNF